MPYAMKPLGCDPDGALEAFIADKLLADGDFAMLETEFQPVLRAMRGKDEPSTPRSRSGSSMSAALLTAGDAGVRPSRLPEQSGA